jgi:hypothetical protein
LRESDIDEAVVWTNYLLNVEPDDISRELYAAACAQVSRLRERDMVVRFALTHPWSIRMLDGALALRGNGSALRGTLLAMAAILETRPHFARYFLPAPTPPAHALFVGLALIRAALGAAAGLLLLRFLRE